MTQICDEDKLLTQHSFKAAGQPMASTTVTAQTVNSCSSGTSVHFYQTTRCHVSEVILPIYNLTPSATDTNILSGDES